MGIETARKIGKVSQSPGIFARCLLSANSAPGSRGETSGSDNEKVFLSCVLFSISFIVSVLPRPTQNNTFFSGIYREFGARGTSPTFGRVLFSSQ